MKRLILLIALLPGIALAQPSQGNSTKITDGAQTLDITAANAAKVDGSAVTQPVSGTVTCNAGSGTLAVSGSVTADTELAAGAASADNTSNPSATSVLNFSHWFDGSTWDRARGDSTDGLLVNLGSNNDVTVTGTVTAQDGGSSLSVDDNGGSLTVDGSVTVTQSTASDLKAQAQIIDAAGDSCMDGTNDALRVNVVAGGAGDGAIQDGASPSVEATVLDYTSSNPLAVRLTDTNGDYIAAGAGTQYTEDAAAAANPIGTALNLVRSDSLSGITTTDGDNVAARGTDKGEIYVKHVDSIPVTDNGSSLTVDGTVTAAQATASSLNAEVQGDAAHDAAVSGNPVLVGAYAKATAPTDVSADGDAVRLWADLAGRLQVGDGGGSLTVDASSLPLPSGASTSANQSTLIGHVDGVEGLLTTIDGDTGNISTKIDTLAGAVSGTEVQVDVLTLPAITGSVTANAGTNLNTSALALETTATSIKTAAELLDDSVVADDAAFTPATTKVLMSGFEFDDSSPDSVNEGDAGAARMSANRNIYTTIRDAAGNERGANVNASNQLSVSVDNTVTVGSHAVTNAGTFAVQESGSALTALQLIDDGIATTGSAITTKGMAASGTDGTNARILKTDSSGELQIDVLTMPTTTVTGTVTASNTAGDVAHDSGDSGNPVKVGYKAANALPTAVANADRANGISDLWGRQLVSHIDPAMQSRKSFNATTQQTGSDVWSPASGKKIAVTSVVISSYATTACRLILWVGANADTTFSEGTDDVIVKASFAPSSTTKPGLVFTPAVPIFTGTADHELHITTDAGCSIDLSIAGYEF